MITLHGYPGNASFTPHVLLNEIGAPFQLQLVDRPAVQKTVATEQLPSPAF